MRVLDVGCGLGIERALQFLNQECSYIGIDISSECIHYNKLKIHELSVSDVDYICDDANHFSRLKGELFDVIIMSGTLHHLDFSFSLPSLKSLLSSNGRVLMWEPMATNPLLRLFRSLTPALRSEDEHPLTFDDFKHIDQFFPRSNYELHSITVLSLVPLLMLGIPLCAVNPLINLFGRLDMLLGKIVFVRRFAWIVIIDLRL